MYCTDIVEHLASDQQDLLRILWSILGRHETHQTLTGHTKALITLGDTKVIERLCIGLCSLILVTSALKRPIIDINLSFRRPLWLVHDLRKVTQSVLFIYTVLSQCIYVCVVLEEMMSIVLDAFITRWQPFLPPLPLYLTPVPDERLALGAIASNIFLRHQRSLVGAIRDPSAASLPIHETPRDHTALASSHSPPVRGGNASLARDAIFMRAVYLSRPST